MPPKTRYTSERIIAAAIELTSRDGVRAVTARSVAAELGCSTAPIFTHFASMDELNERLLDSAMEHFADRVGADLHGDPLLAVGRGWLRFATEEPRLYEAIFLTRHPWHRKWGGLRRQLADAMANHPRYAGLDRAFRFGLVGRASVVVHGIGLELWAGRLSPGEEDGLLEELVLPVVDSAIAAHWNHDLHLSGPAPRKLEENAS